jgi:hypothetical protein
LFRRPAASAVAIAALAVAAALGRWSAGPGAEGGAGGRAIAEAASPRERRGAVEAEAAFAETARRVKRSVVAIGTYQRNQRPAIRYAGTGFVVHDGNTAVTNEHVIAGIRERGELEDLRVFIPDVEAPRGFAAGVWAEDARHDAALVRFRGPRMPALELSDGSEARFGDEVGIVGFPIGLALGAVPAVHRGVVAARVPAVLPLPAGHPMSPRLKAALANPYELLQLDLVAYPGNSGSVVFEPGSTKAVAVLNKTLATQTREHLLSKPSGIAYAVPARWAGALLKATLDAKRSSSDRRGGK